MPATLWTKNGKLVSNGSGNLVLCEICPCLGDDHESPCNPLAPVPGTLTLTINFNGITIEVPLVWGAEVCPGGEGWTYTGPDVEICEDLSLKAGGAALCCGGETWGLGLSLIINTVEQGFETGAGLNELTINDQSPIDYETQTTSPFVACGVTEDVFVNITTPP